MAKPMKLTHPDGGTVTTRKEYLEMYQSQGWTSKKTDQPKPGDKPDQEEK